MIRLHDYWRSGAAYRVRIALNLKGVSHQVVTHDLRTGAQREPIYLERNPQGLLPAIETGGGTITQSLAIMEWLEERYPEVPILPSGADDRAIVRSMAQIICCDIHPLNNLRVFESLRSDLDAREDQVQAWIGRWINQGFAAIEAMVKRHGGKFAFGDQPTMADCCLVPQAYTAARFNVPLTPFPAIEAVVANARDVPAFALAAPERQAGAD